MMEITIMQIIGGPTHPPLFLLHWLYIDCLRSWCHVFFAACVGCNRLNMCTNRDPSGCCNVIAGGQCRADCTTGNVAVAELGYQCRKHSTADVFHRVLLSLYSQEWTVVTLLWVRIKMLTKIALMKAVLLHTHAMIPFFWWMARTVTNCPVWEGQTCLPSGMGTHNCAVRNSTTITRPRQTQKKPYFC